MQRLISLRRKLVLMARNQVFHHRLLLIALGTLAPLLILEGLFRLLGFVLAVPSITIPGGAKTARIICVGDSSTKGVGSSDAKQYSYPSQLQSLLDAAAPGRFEVVNLGQPGINSSQVLNRFEATLATFRPELVIAMIGINDAWNLNESNVLRFYNGTIPSKALLSIELALSRLRVYRFVKLVYLSLTTSLGDQGVNSDTAAPPVQIPRYGPETKEKGFQVSHDDLPKTAAISHALETNITNLSLIAKSREVPIIFMRYHNSGWGHPEQIIDRTYSWLDVPIIDNYSVFQEAQQRGLNVRGADGWHPNDLGYLLIAKNVFNHLIALRVLQAEPLPLFEESSPSRAQTPEANTN